MSTAIDIAAEKCGGLSRLAERLNASVQTVSNWRLRGAPVDRCAEIEKVSGSAVMRWHLRPDDWHRIWPELIGIEGAPQPTDTAKAA